MKQRMLLAFLFVSASLSAQATDIVFKVNLTQDRPDINVGDGICAYTTAVPADQAAVCTLRAAVMEANAVGLEEQANVVIELKPGATYDLTRAGAMEQQSVFGDLDLLRPMHIGVPDDAPAKAHIANGATGDRIFHIQPAAAGSSLYGIELTGGQAGFGCVIYNQAADLELRWLDIHGNCQSEATTNYALALASTTTIVDTSIHHNVASSDGSSYSIYAFSVGTTLGIERSSIYWNMKPSSGGAVYLIDGAHLRMRDSTVSQNGSAESFGIGLNTSATADIGSSTIVFNGVSEIAVISSPETIVTNSILIPIPAGDVCRADDADVFDIRWSLIGDASCKVGVITGQDNEHDVPIVAVDLSELGEWGGVTPNHCPGPNSIAIDHTPASECDASIYDQRGFARVVSYDGSQPARCDTGAVELEALPVDPDPTDPFAEGFKDDFEMPPTL